MQYIQDTSSFMYCLQPIRHFELDFCVVQVEMEINLSLYQLPEEYAGGAAEWSSIAFTLPKALKTRLSARLHSGFKCKITFLGIVNRQSHIYTQFRS